MDTLIQEFAGQLLKGNQDGAWNILLAEVERGADSLEIYQHLFTESLIYIGQLWERNEIKVADEHLASSACDFLLSRYFHHKQMKKKAEPSGKKAMFFCLEQEQHYLGMKMVALLFEEDGWETRFLGPNLPLEYVMNMASAWKPDLIGMSSATLYSADRMETYMDMLQTLEHKPVILIGGRIIFKYHFRELASDSVLLIEKLEDLKQYQPVINRKKGLHV